MAFAQVAAFYEHGPLHEQTGGCTGAFGVGVGAVIDGVNLPLGRPGKHVAILIAHFNAQYGVVDEDIECSIAAADLLQLQALQATSKSASGLISGSALALHRRHCFCGNCQN